MGDKSSLGKFKKIEIVSRISSDHNVMRLDINYRKRICKKYKHMEAKQYTTKKNNGSMMKSKKKSENTLRQMTMKIKPYKIYGM